MNPGIAIPASPESRIEIVRQVESLTRAMLDKAKLGELDSLSALEQQRQAQLKRYAAEGIADGDLMELRTLLENLLQMDNELRQVCDLLRAELANNLDGIKSIKKAHAAYQAHTSS